MLLGRSTVALLRRHSPGTRVGVSVKELLQVSDQLEFPPSNASAPCRKTAKAAPSEPPPVQKVRQIYQPHPEPGRRAAATPAGPRRSSRRAYSAPPLSAAGPTTGADPAASATGRQHHHREVRRPDSGLQVNGVGTRGRPFSAEQSPRQAAPRQALRGLGQRDAPEPSRGAARPNVYMVHHGSRAQSPQQAHPQGARRQVWDGAGFALPETLLSGRPLVRMASEAGSAAERTVRGGLSRRTAPSGAGGREPAERPQPQAECWGGRRRLAAMQDHRAEEDASRLGAPGARAGEALPGDRAAQQADTAAGDGSTPGGERKGRGQWRLDDLAAGRGLSPGAAPAGHACEPRASLDFSAACGSGARGVCAIIHNAANPLGSASARTAARGSSSGGSDAGPAVGAGPAGTATCRAPEQSVGGERAAAVDTGKDTAQGPAAVQPGAGVSRPGTPAGGLLSVPVGSAGDGSIPEAQAGLKREQGTASVAQRILQESASLREEMGIDLGEVLRSVVLECESCYRIVCFAD
eukprot:CAMPEP_0177614084 /NCGR_PEP_ID=MMETSP0419_2-20121207/22426_1 /TAXON_ID=582737 /ORGANISM="Tetraselmis sp., Strain GSL018" /LENGTH=521 /DNA_ID=CAMNT_0019111037 /DNA_START=125 /DNA_END=1690 /DNA_ORIENTATION=+